MVALGLIACALFAFALLSRRVEGTVVTGPMVFVAAGLVCGWTGLVEFGSAAHGGDHDAAREIVFLVAELALVLLLFTDAARIDPRSLRGNPLPARLLGIGLPLTVGLGALVGLLVLTDLEPWECAIVAAVLAPTDAALGQAVISSPAVPERVREGLGVESGLNDGGSVPFLMLFMPGPGIASCVRNTAPDGAENGPHDPPHGPRRGIRTGGLGPEPHDLLLQAPDLARPAKVAQADSHAERDVQQEDDLPEPHQAPRRARDGRLTRISGRARRRSAPPAPRAPGGRSPPGGARCPPSHRGPG